MVCVDNFCKTKNKNLDDRLLTKYGIIHKLKKRYIYESIYGGICPTCGEFNVRDHLLSFRVNHFLELSEMTPDEKQRRKEYKISELYRTFPCSELVKEMEKQKGGYTCANCYYVIQTNTEIINKIYDNEYQTRAKIIDKNRIIKKFEQNLIYCSNLIKNPIKLDMRQENLILTNYLFTLYENSEEKGEITSFDREENMIISRPAIIKFFIKRKELLEKYGKIVPARGRIPLKYYINDNGKKIECLMELF